MYIATYLNIFSDFSLLLFHLFNIYLFIYVEDIILIVSIGWVEEEAFKQII